MVGVILTVLPWLSLSGLFGDWGDNYFLTLISTKLGSQTLQRAISSGWVRGAVTGLGLLNLFLAGWSIARFKQTVHDIDEDYTTPNRTIKDVVPAKNADTLSNN